MLFTLAYVISYVFQVEIEKMRRAERILSGQKSSSQRSVNTAAVVFLTPPVYA